MTTSKDVLAMMAELVTLTGLDEGSPQSFKVRAYEKASLALQSDGRDITTLTSTELQKIDGVGKATASKIREFVEQGTVEKLETLRRKYPPEFVELSRIPGMGPKTLNLERSELGVSNVDELRVAIAEERLRDLPGLGATTEAKLEKAIERLGLTGKDRRSPIADVLPLAERLVDDLRALPQTEDAKFCGSLRRMSETIGDIDITVASLEPAQVMQFVVAHHEVRELVVHGETKTSFLTASGLQVDVRVVAPSQFGAATLYFTGSKAHNIALRQRAIDRQMLLNEYGLMDASNEDLSPDERPVIASAHEAEIYACLLYTSPSPRDQRGSRMPSSA